jgi:hypothetical protein
VGHERLEVKTQDILSADLIVMAMNVDDGLSRGIRILAAIGGFFSGAISGGILFIVVIIISRSDFGFTNAWPASLGGAIAGSILGFLFPKIMRFFITVFTYFP